MVAVRSFANALGFRVEWNSSRRQIVLRNDNTFISMHVGHDSFVFIPTDGRAVQTITFLDSVSPMIIDDSTFIPLRSLAEVLGYRVITDSIPARMSVQITQGLQRTFRGVRQVDYEVLGTYDIGHVQWQGGL